MFNKYPKTLELVASDGSKNGAQVLSVPPEYQMQVSQGSRLVAINDRNVMLQSYLAILKILQKAKTPITIRFTRLEPVNICVFFFFCCLRFCMCCALFFFCMSFSYDHMFVRLNVVCSFFL